MLETEVTTNRASLHDLTLTDLAIPEKPEGAIRIICMSDTHGHHKKHKLVAADIFVHGI